MGRMEGLCTEASYGQSARPLTSTVDVQVILNLPYTKIARMYHNEGVKERHAGQVTFASDDALPARKVRHDWQMQRARSALPERHGQSSYLVTLSMASGPRQPPTDCNGSHTPAVSSSSPAHGSATTLRCDTNTAAKTRRNCTCTLTLATAKPSRLTAQVAHAVAAGSPVRCQVSQCCGSNQCEASVPIRTTRSASSETRGLFISTQSAPSPMHHSVGTPACEQVRERCRAKRGNPGALVP